MKRSRWQCEIRPRVGPDQRCSPKRWSTTGNLSRVDGGGCAESSSAPCGGSRGPAENLRQSAGRASTEKAVQQDGSERGGGVLLGKDGRERGGRGCLETPEKGNEGPHTGGEGVEYWRERTRWWMYSGEKRPGR